MKRIFAMVAVFAVVLSLMVVPALAAGSIVLDLGVDNLFYIIGSCDPGTYTLTVTGTVDGEFYDFRTDPFEIGSCSSSETVDLYVDGDKAYTVTLDKIYEDISFEFSEVYGDFPEFPFNETSARLVLHPYISGADVFQNTINDGLVTVISWVSSVLFALVGAGGAFSSILPLVAVCIAVPAFFFGIKAVRKFIWGA